MHRTPDKKRTMEDEESISARADREKSDKKSMNTTVRPLLESSKFIVDDLVEGEEI